MEEIRKFHSQLRTLFSLTVVDSEFGRGLKKKKNRKNTENNVLFGKEAQFTLPIETSYAMDKEELYFYKLVFQLLFPFCCLIERAATHEDYPLFFFTHSPCIPASSIDVR